jgi:hypothetical protein
MGNMSRRAVTGAGPGRGLASVSPPRQPPAGADTAPRDDDFGTEFDGDYEDEQRRALDFEGATLILDDDPDELPGPLLPEPLQHHTPHKLLDDELTALGNISDTRDSEFHPPGTCRQCERCYSSMLTCCSSSPAVFLRLGEVAPFFGWNHAGCI